MPFISLPPLLVSSSEVVPEPKARGKSPFAHLETGQKVTARVLEMISHRRALLMIGGQRVHARTFLPLQTGQEVLLRMDRTGGRQVFKFEGLVSGTGAQRPLPMGLFGESRPYVTLSRLLETLQLPGTEGAEGSRHLTALESLLSGLRLPPDGAPPPPDFLNRLMGGSGLLWESKLAALTQDGEPPTPSAVQRLVSGDLKALVLELLSDPKLSTAKVPGQESAAEQLRGVLEGLERHQLLNQHLLENDGRYLLPLLLSGAQPFQFGQLLLGLGERGEGGDSRERVVTVSLLLTLSRLGALRADVLILKDRVTGTFGVADEASRDLVSRCLPELQAKLRGHGFAMCDFTCRVLAPEQLSETSLVAQAMAPPAEGFFNLVV